ncbi:MAG: serine/threonine-protein kinase [Pseudomonadota bacterium]
MTQEQDTGATQAQTTTEYITMNTVDWTQKETTPTQAAHALGPGEVLLHGQYTIQSYLSSGGFGVTYLAHDSLDRPTVIKECFPVLTCHRKGKTVMGRTSEDRETFAAIVRNLMHEARRMARLDHPNIVGVHQVFEENGTAYMALDFIDGLDLLELIHQDPARLTPDVVNAILRKTLDAVAYMHDSNMLHRDISPDNILITSDNEPVLIDFGAAREVTNKASKTLSSLDSVKEGYSPLEFYSKDAEQTGTSDIYSLGASLYHVLMGKAPPDSLARLSAVSAEEGDPLTPLPSFIEGYDPLFLSAINHALELFPRDRMQSAMEWMDQIDEDRRRQALLAAAQEDTGLEHIVKELIDRTRNDTATVNAVRQAEAARRERNAAQWTHSLPPIDLDQKPTHDIFGDPLPAEDFKTDFTIPQTEREEKPARLGGVLGLCKSIFSSKSTPLEAES